ncbi:MAG TPA: class I SAM-dependent methyltransferase [Tepidisphaeraceae bacterium]|nr:class I SAM-dependent methyltransferase [Tepidisphaeraceae bacterium]
MPHHHYSLKDDPSSSHGQIARIVRQINRGPVLDVGSAQGIFGRLLRDTGLTIDAVEPNPAWADEARPFYRTVFTGTIETVCSSLPRRHYATIICGDVLEHTVDPVLVLRRLREHALPDATFVISLPNVAHVSVRMMLLFGMFPRMQRGILDRTHLHFFTRRTAIQMLHEAGLRVERVLATPVPLAQLAGDNARRRRILSAISSLQRPLVALLPRMFAFQWIFVAQEQTVAPPSDRPRP